MATHPVDADATASRVSSSSTARNASTSAAQRRPDAVQLSAADCSVGDDTGASVVLAVSASASASEQQQLVPPPPPFEPLFALLTNTTTGTTVHPRVHYLFSDDDASLPTDEPSDHDDAAEDQHDRRSLVVDLVPTPARDAWAVSCASSLGPAFAVTGAALSKQQAGESNATDASPSSGGGGGAAALMLHVEGVSRDPVDLRASAEAGGGSLRSLSGSAGGEDVEGLAEDFRRRMGVLKKVVGEGEKRRAVSSVTQQEQHDEAEAGSHEIHDPGALRSETAGQSHGAATSTS